MDPLNAEIIRLKDEIGLTYREIGAKLGMDQEAVRGRYRRNKKVGYDGGKVSFREEGNYASGSVLSETPLPLDEFQKKLRVDTDIWKVRNWGAKHWNLGAKIKEGSLTWTDGRMDGHLDYKGLGKEDLWSTWADFIRRVPIASKPIIKPVTCKAFSPPRLRGSDAEGVGMILADPHLGYVWNPPHWELVPFHDRRVLDLFIQIARIVKPIVIDILGDFFDFAVWQSRYARLPGLYNATQPAIYEGHRFLRCLRQDHPDSEIRVHKGNHDERIEKTLAEYAQDAYSLKAADMDLPVMSVPFLLGFEQLQIEWIDGYPNDVASFGEVAEAQHGHIARSKPLATVTAALKGKIVSQFVGHIHRHEEAEEQRRIDGRTRTITGYCPGCACYIDGRVPGSEKNDWSNGFGIIYWHGEDMTISHVPTRDKRAIYNGKLYEASDWLPGLRKDYPDWNWGE